MTRAAVKALASRVAKLSATITPRRRYVVISEDGSGVYWHNGESWSRATLDELLTAGHSIVIREIPIGYLGL